MSVDYRIFETDPFSRDLRKLARAGEKRVIEKLRAVVYPQLRSQPRSGSNIRRLANWSPETWRYRIGSWRFFYEIDDKEWIVFMTAASHRSSAYD